MKNTQEIIDELAKIILDRDESMFRVFVIDLCKSFSPSQTRKIIFEALEKSCDIENSLEPTIWAKNLDNIESPRDRKIRLQKLKQEILQALINNDYVESEDYELTPNESIRLLSQEAIEAVKNCMSNNQWEWIVHSKVIRIARI